MMNDEMKPALGIMPRKLFEEKRIMEISTAIHGYASRGQIVPSDWVAELSELVDQQSDWKVK